MNSKATSRVIKFRAWDIQDKMMFTPVEIIWSERTGERLDIRRAGGLNDFWRNAELMQFTGLLDKNGKEIYEGDIIDDLCGHIFKVEDITPIHKEMYYDFDRYDDFMSMSDVDYMVIGNIYEHPNLLQKKGNE